MSIINYIKAYIEDNEDYLLHYGMPRRSGRYPWGSGEDPYQHSGSFVDQYYELKDKGFSELEIARNMKISTTQLRVKKRYAADEWRQFTHAKAKSLREKGWSLRAIAKELGYDNDSSVRSLLNEHTADKMKQAKATANFLKAKIDDAVAKGEPAFFEVGEGCERQLGVSRTKLDEALYMLDMEGYSTFTRRIPQVTNMDKRTTLMLLCPPGTEYKDIYDTTRIASVIERSHDGGETFQPKWVYPKSIDSKRVAVKYAEEGGVAKDGLVEIRRGVEDLDLGKSTYAQVRILVDGTHYIKGMAVYSDNLPDGVDILFNTNKHIGTPLTSEDPKAKTVLKPIKNDPTNPFGANLREEGGQSYYTDKDGNKQLGLINKTRQEGDWSDWSNTLPSQFLSKQRQELIDRQLNLTKQQALDNFNEIMELDNPTIKRKMLLDFAGECDSAAVDLKSASLPGQAYHVIIPIPELKDNEVYAPAYKDGTKLALVRYPHAGTFEIPILTVNNKNQAAIDVLTKTPRDAVGINMNVANVLSGADFDGDTVMAIPTSSKVRISSRDPLEGLKNFDPKMEYGGKSEGTYKRMKKDQEGKQMGMISNLITDMTLKGATDDELVRAVKHSMVVIDAEKHGLDYKQSEIDNNILALKNKYQGMYNEKTNRLNTPAATLLSRSKGQASKIKTVGSPRIDPDTGELIYKLTDKIDSRTGKLQTKKSTQMAETKDARLLSSGTPQEEAYADYANSMKMLANEARKAYLSTERLKYNPEAKAKYINEVETLNAKLDISLMNAPKERRAQIMANIEIDTRVKAAEEIGEEISPGNMKKIRQRAIVKAREAVGAKHVDIDITPKEWEAIQSGAITDSKLKQIIDHVDSEKLVKLATPRIATTLSPTKISKIQSMKSMDYTPAQIAEACGISVSSVYEYIKG